MNIASIYSTGHYPSVKHQYPRVNRQRGMVLIISLIMVLLMSIVALSAIRGSGMQELMAGNMRDNNLAFQAAEAGLRDAEFLLDQGSVPAFDGSVVGFLPSNPNSIRAGFWHNYDWSNSVTATHLGLEWLAHQPRYVIEEVRYVPTIGTSGGGIDFASSLNAEDAVIYRITSSGIGGSLDSRVILQTTYKR